MVSFCRERFRPMGGPDGGDGGHGGDVICYLDPQLSSLENLTHQKRYAGGNGGRGGSARKHGADGHDCLLPLPAGTIIRPHEGEQQYEITAKTPRYTLLHGGRGGHGNAKFKTAHNRAPRFAQPGGEGGTGRVDMELRMIAQVGLVGMPNAGKSSLLRALSRAIPAVADYPFTSLVPTLGVMDPPMEWRSADPLTTVDIPGIISGAASGHGLGNEFLRHLSRVHIIAFVLSLTDLDGMNTMAQLNLLHDELQAYDHTLRNRIALIIANKCDCDEASAALSKLRTSTSEMPVMACSATRGDGLAELIARLYRLYYEHHTQ